MQAAFAEHLECIVSALASHLASATPDERQGALRERALRTWSELVGALVLSRAVVDAAPELSDEVLAATRKGVTRA